MTCLNLRNVTDTWPSPESIRVIDPYVTWEVGIDAPICALPTQPVHQQRDSRKFGSSSAEFIYNGTRDDVRQKGFVAVPDSICCKLPIPGMRLV